MACLIKVKSTILDPRHLLRHRMSLTEALGRVARRAPPRVPRLFQSAGLHATLAITSDTTLRLCVQVTCPSILIPSPWLMTSFRKFNIRP